MNPHQLPASSPAAMFGSLCRNRHFILQLARQEIVARYRGSWLGLVWSFITPVILLAVYTFVFSVVFKARWNIPVMGGTESKMDFAIILFAGLVMYTVFAEAVNRAPGLILANANYVKKVIFPIEILPAVVVMVTLFHAVISIGVLLAAQLLVNHNLPWTVIFLPFIVLPLALGTMGVTWIISALGVFIRDIAHMVGLFTTSLMFLTPIMYPVTALPQDIQSLMHLNPLAYVVEESRAVLIYGQMPHWDQWLLAMAVALATVCIGFWWFQRTRRGFADVL